MGSHSRTPSVRVAGGRRVGGTTGECSREGKTTPISWWCAAEGGQGRGQERSVALCSGELAPASVGGDAVGEHDTVSVARVEKVLLCCIGYRPGEEGEGECNGHVDLHGVVRGKGIGEASVVVVGGMTWSSPVAFAAAWSVLERSEGVLSLVCARREKYCGELHIVFGAHSTVSLCFSTPSRVRCGVGRKPVERVCTDGGGEANSIGFLSFMVE